MKINVCRLKSQTEKLDQVSVLLFLKKPLVLASSVDEGSSDSSDRCSLNNLTGSTSAIQM